MVELLVFKNAAYLAYNRVAVAPLRKRFALVAGTDGDGALPK